MVRLLHQKILEFTSFFSLTRPYFNRKLFHRQDILITFERIKCHKVFLFSNKNNTAWEFIVRNIPRSLELYRQRFNPLTKIAGRGNSLATPATYLVLVTWCTLPPLSHNGQSTFDTRWSIKNDLQSNINFHTKWCASQSKMSCWEWIIASLGLILCKWVVLVFSMRDCYFHQPPAILINDNWFSMKLEVENLPSLFSWYSKRLQVKGRWGGLWVKLSTNFTSAVVCVKSQITCGVPAKPYPLPNVSRLLFGLHKF